MRYRVGVSNLSSLPHMSNQLIYMPLGGDGASIEISAAPAVGGTHAATPTKADSPERHQCVTIPQSRENGHVRGRDDCAG